MKTNACDTQWHRGVAQFGRALRSGRRGRKFESCRLDLNPNLLRLCSQAVKTSPSHGEGPGSIPGKVTKACQFKLAGFFRTGKSDIIVCAKPNKIEEQNERAETKQ